jgi:phosphoribosyl 1,2-cyclic phosphodiesterase
MKVTLWGVRGSLATPGLEMARYGGNTSCVEVSATNGTTLVLDAGTGIRILGNKLVNTARRIDVLLTHLHMDHVQGLGFFAPLYNPATEVHIWGPASTTLSLETRIARYLSPPLFPVRLRDLPHKPVLHEVPSGNFEIGEFRVSAMLVCHPGPTVGYRIESQDAARTTVTYLPDHEPALGLSAFPINQEWTSGYALAEGADLLIHDAQYNGEEYGKHVGWGHSSLPQALQFAALAQVRQLVPFHHDPAHTDEVLDRMIATAVASAAPTFTVTPGIEGTTFEIGVE